MIEKIKQSIRDHGLGSLEVSGLVLGFFGGFYLTSQEQWLPGLFHVIWVLAVMAVAGYALMMLGLEIEIRIARFRLKLSKKRKMRVLHISRAMRRIHRRHERGRAASLDV